jgi:hypothetical protein
MKVEKIIGDLWDRRLACHRARTGETPIPQELPDLIFNFYKWVESYVQRAFQPPQSISMDFGLIARDSSTGGLETKPIQAL